MSEVQTSKEQEFKPIKIDTQKTSDNSVKELGAPVTLDEINAVNPINTLKSAGSASGNDKSAADNTVNGSSQSDAITKTTDKLRKNSTKVIPEKTNIRSASVGADRVQAAPVNAARIREANANAVPRTKKQKREDARQNIIHYREELAQAEQAIFAGYGGTMLTKGAYSSFGSIETKKRKDEVIEREKHADVIREFTDSDEYKNRSKIGYIMNSDDMKKVIDDFMKNVQRTEDDFSSDENFVRHIRENYNLGITGAKLKKWISDAVNGGYMPEDVDMEAVQQKIARFEELKEYLDARIAVVTSPYYKYFSKDDINYSDKQLNDFINGFARQSEDFRKQNDELFKYLSAVQKLRKLSINRKKGLSSVTERTERKARHEAELIRTRAEKRECIAKLRDRALKAQGKTSSRDSIDKLAFSRERFDFLAKEFDSVRLSDIRFGDLGDVTDYANVNSMFFDQAREMGQMLQLAIDKEELDADEWTENRMLKLRAKLRSFEVMEKLIGSVRREALENPEAVLNKYTYDELLQRAAEKLDEKDIPAYPEFGSNLEKFYNSVLSSYKKIKI